MSKPNRKNLRLRNGTWHVQKMIDGIPREKTTGMPKSERAAANRMKDQIIAAWMEEAARRKRGEPEPIVLPILTLKEVIAMYLADESKPFDRARGDELGTKRNWEGDRVVLKRIERACDTETEARLVDEEFLLNLAAALGILPKVRGIGRLSNSARRKCFELLRLAFNWAKSHPIKSGITSSPFDRTIGKKQVRQKLFPKVPKRGYLFGPEELRALYAGTNARTARLLRFLVHTGLRISEATTLIWGNVDLEAKTARVEQRIAKAKVCRDVALGDVALEILRLLGPREDDAPVFVGRTGKAFKVRSVEDSFDRSLFKFWKPTGKPNEKPTIHSFRKTGATRVEEKSSHAIARRFLGHADEDITDTYLMPTLDKVREAINRAARSLDGETPPGTIPFPAQVGTNLGAPVESTTERLFTTGF